MESKERAEKLLEELEKQEIKQQLEVDKEGITEEERYMLRKVGLKMRPFLLLGESQFHITQHLGFVWFARHTKNSNPSPV